MEWLVNQMGNPDDVRASLRLGNYTVDELIQALVNERHNRNRKTVINMLRVAIQKIHKTQSL
jgi:hypothetical protein